MAEKTREYSFKIHLNEAESERFETYVREAGMKKLAVMRKAIIKYLEENGPNTGN